MNVRVCGPNLNDQSKGSFHVHRDGCRDLDHYGPGRRFGGDMYGQDEMLINDATVMKVVCDVYADQLEESGDDPESYVNDFWFAPCCSQLMYPIKLWGALHFLYPDQFTSKWQWAKTWLDVE